MHLFLAWTMYRALPLAHGELYGVVCQRSRLPNYPFVRVPSVHGTSCAHPANGFCVGAFCLLW